MQNIAPTSFITVRDILTFLPFLVAIAGSHFMLRTQVMVLEERIGNHYESIVRMFHTLARIEKKLDHKADK